MTVSATTAKDQYTGTGSLQVFAYTFRILDETHVKVEVEDVNGTITTQTLTTHYTVSGVGSSSGGNITFVTAPAATDTIIITRNVPLSQTTDYVENDPFPAASHEDALDKLTMIAQQLDEATDRAVKVPVSSTITDLTLPVTANAYLKWNSTATALTAVVLTDTGALTQVIEDTTPQLGGDLDANGSNIGFDDATGIEDDSGNEQLIFQKTTSAVNHIEITNAATGNGPSVAAAGDDTNIDLSLSGKGTGTVDIGSNEIKFDSGNGIVDGNGNEALTFTTTASAVNELTIANAATGGEPTISATGGDTNVSINLSPKGTGTVNVLGTSDAGATIRLFEDTDNGSSSVGLKAPDSIASNVTWTLPSADGTSGQFLSTNGSGTLSWASGGGGAWNVLGTATASSSASVEFTSLIDATYDIYAIVWYNVVPATDAVTHNLNTSTDNGTTWRTSGYKGGVFSIAGTSENVVSVTTSVQTCSSTSGFSLDAGATTTGQSGILYITNVNSTSHRKQIWGQASHLENTGTNICGTHFGGMYDANEDIDAVRMIMSSGNIASGEYILYGITTST